MNALHPVTERAIQNRHGRNANGHLMAQKQAQSRQINAEIAEWIADGNCITVAESAGPFERFNKEDELTREQVETRRKKLADSMRKGV